MTRTGHWWITNVRRYQSLTTAAKWLTIFTTFNIQHSTTFTHHLVTELLLCAKHWARLLFWFVPLRIFSSLKKHLPVSKWRPGQWARWLQSPTTPGLQLPQWAQSAELKDKRWGTVENSHKFIGGQEGRVAISRLEISLSWWRSVRAAWLIWGMDKVISQLSTCMKLLQLFPWTGKGQNLVGHTILSPKVWTGI